ncbi:MAG TPA: hypothetical protein VGQ83_24195 [Polyangia bacterium]
MSWHRVAITLAVALAATPTAAAPPDDPASGIVIVAMQTCCPAEAWPEAEEAARAELVGLGIAVEVVPGVAISERDRRVELRVLAGARRAASALRIVRPPGEERRGGVEIWLEDRLTGRTVVRHLVVGEHPGREGARLAALKTVEAVRAGAIELTFAQADAARRPRPEAVTRAPAAPVEASPRWSLRASGAVVGGPGGLGPHAAMAAGARWQARPALAIDVDATVSLGGARVALSGGSATCDLAALRAWALWTPRLGGRWHAALGGGAGVALAGAALIIERLGSDGARAWAQPTRIPIAAAGAIADVGAQLAAADPAGGVVLAYASHCAGSISRAGRPR